MNCKNEYEQKGEKDKDKINLRQQEKEGGEQRR